MGREYNDDQLSRILGEHEAGQLLPGGSTRWEQYTRPKIKMVPGGMWGGHGFIADGYEEIRVGCINQAALNDPSRLRAAHRWPKKAAWFDQNYDRHMPAEALLEELQK